MKPPADPLVSTVFLIGFLGVLCALILLLAALELASAALFDRLDRWRLRRPFAKGVRFPRPVDYRGS